ncbi:MAG: hypothetical protein HY234_07710 [Acidobacteria bacterium]|nr:hypothetical protein [Acidobacteriota bacterium]MBI3662919.1 hypothetical protein [Acidobacteriota bacterium]
MKARKALENLKATIKKRTWRPTHPEYFHTEAHLEFQEYLMGKRKGANRDFLRTKLKTALDNIDAAIQLYPKRLYEDLKRNIEEARVDL